MLEAEISNNQAQMAKHQEAINKLSMSEKQYKEDAEQLRITLHREHQELETLQTNIAVLKAQEDALPEFLSVEKKKQKAVRTAAEHKNQEVEKKERELQNLLKESTNGAEFYKSRLGLDFEKIEDSSLRFCFTKIDLLNPEKRFIFSVSVDGNDVYRVVECNPKIEGLLSLVEKLNITNNFAEFMQSMRRQFQAKCRV